MNDGWLWLSTLKTIASLSSISITPAFSPGPCIMFLPFVGKVLNTDNSFCSDYKKKDIIELPIAHNEGNYFANDYLIKKLEDNNLIVFKYCNKEGSIEDSANPNGSLNNIAGIISENKNILGMMPHPERSIDPILSGEDGSLLFKSIFNHKN